MTLTKEQKLEAYRYALKKLENDKYEFICFPLKQWYRSEIQYVDSIKNLNIPERFPEIWEYRIPKDVGHGAWCASNSYKIKALKQVIKELEK